MTTSKSTTTFCRENASVVKFSIRYFTIWKTCGISELNKILVEPEIKYPKTNFDTIGKFFFFFFFLYFDMVKRLFIDDLLGKQFYASLKLLGFSVTFLVKFSHAVVFSHFIFNSKYSDWFKFHSPTFYARNV